MNLPKYLFNLFTSSLIVIVFHSSAIAFEGDNFQDNFQDNFRDNLLAQNPNCDNPQSQAEMNICAARYYQAADRKLNQVYQQLSSQMRSQLTLAQLAWIDFRDTNCDFARSLFEGGTIAPSIYNGCLGGMTEQRTIELEAYQSRQIPQPTSRNYQQVDQKLNQVYQNFIAQLNGFNKNKLQTAELAWIKFRDTNCAFEGTQTSGGENLCKIRMTEQRTEELAQLMDLLF
ncbi:MULTISPECIES: lysozyme inhibitor LprI family protein [Planktothricoides]|uniref:Lysozyme inhibitor LprI family protein n=2 Tax=Planktothricoides raciborskii TaxID=132608 RepID=A0AAU8JEK7_9CYAN|nr:MULTISPECIES: lysozyme inhibitor LprI family protein [Planktothricoides]MBD2544166.1 DUF1311 domain-containing protein [Planktothricoides raciborskii FACHB-1370]MBD2583938.1 DUF1311 domain-containing protein [Planktothricoides raciborskii FACHB-1261]